MSASFIELSGLVIPRRDAVQAILDISRLSLDRSEAVAIVGPSGAGKTSLLSVLAGLHRPSQGRVIIDGVAINDLNAAALTQWRRRNVGIVLQNPHLIPEMRAIENVLLPTYFDRIASTLQLRERAGDLLKTFAIDPVAVTGILSRGEQQRVALARALFSEPPLIIADEPTANLDATTGELVISKLVEIVRKSGAKLVVATHDTRLSAQCKRLIVLRNGRLVRAS